MKDNPELLYQSKSFIETVINSKLLLNENSLKLFNDLIEAGVCREQARGILPQNLYTEYYGTCNANNLLKFIELRIHDGAQWEIQQVAKACGQIARNLWPEMMSAYEEVRGVSFDF